MGPTSKAAITHQRPVEGQLEIAEVLVKLLHQHPHEVFARHHGHVGFHFQRDAHGQDDAAYQQIDYLANINHRIQILDDEHAEVDAQAEE